MTEPLAIVEQFPCTEQTEPVIKADGISKRFGDITALDKLSLSIGKGEIFGLLGPNAAGKSTAIRLLSGILRLDGGSASLLGFDLRRQSEEIKKRIGYVAQFFALYPELTVSENLDFYSALYRFTGREKREKMLERYGLTRFASRRAGELSGGYKRRLSIACAMAHDPELVFLDEPTAGIDPITRKELWEIFYDMAASGKTLFITTHYMEEAGRCGRLAFLHEGRKVADGSPDEIKHSMQDKTVFSCRTGYRPELSESLKKLKGVFVLNQFGDELRIITESSLTSKELSAVIRQNIGKDAEVRPAETGIEDVFITLTQGRRPL